MEEKDLVAGNWYKVKTTIYSSTGEGTFWYFPCEKSGSANNVFWITIYSSSMSTGGCLSGERNGSFEKEYHPCTQQETMWAEKCKKENRYSDPLKQDSYSLLIF